MANFKLGDSASKSSTSIGTTKTPGVNIIPQRFFIMPYAGPYTSFTVASASAGATTITVSATTNMYVGQGIYNSTYITGTSTKITAIVGTSITIDSTISTTFSTTQTFYVCPAGWVFCDGNNGTPAIMSANGGIPIGASSSANLGALLGGTHAHTMTPASVTTGNNIGSHDTLTQTTVTPTYTYSHQHTISVGITTGSNTSANFVNMNSSGNVSKYGRTHTHNTNTSTIVSGSQNTSHAHNVLTHTNALDDNSGLMGSISHTHTGTAAQQDSSTATSAIPPYLSMRYIMKVA